MPHSSKSHQPQPDGCRPDATGGVPARRRLLGALAGAGGAAVLGLAAPRLAVAKGLELGRPAPPLVLHTLDGRHLSTRDLQGQVVILAFWATWCEPCCAELPLLSAYADKHAGDGLTILGFSLDEPDDLPAVRKMAAHLSFPVGLLGSAYAGEYGRIWKMPVSFVLDRNGHLADNGWQDADPAWTPDRFRRVVDPLLAPRGAA